MRRLVVLAAFAALYLRSGDARSVAPGGGWVVARSAHFEVYSNTGAETAKTTLTHFEELRSFFEENHLVPAGVGSPNKQPLRVIVFGTKREYDSFKIRAGADAYYTGTPDRDYIVMPSSPRGDFSVAAHEYAHFLLHSAGLKLPAWMSEGLAEVFSTVSISEKRCDFGGPIPARVQTLRRSSWLNASEFFSATPNSVVRGGLNPGPIFYAQSWALVDMLTSSPDYAPRFGDLISLLRSGEVDSTQALADTYRQTGEAIVTAAQDWIARGRSFKRRLPSLPAETFGMKVASVSDFDVRATLADLLLANDALDRAEQMYKVLLHEAPNNPELLASLGMIALREGDRHGAIQYWHLALDHGLADVNLCYWYAALAEESGLPAQEIEGALERAVQIRPDFQDALFRLALLKSNAGEYSAAVDELQSMIKPQGKRAFGYWIALAYALGELGRRDESERAAKEAMVVAGSREERARAADIAYMAKTDLAVRFERKADGELQLVTTRVPHGTTDFNPFVEAGDRVRVETGTLREVQCSAGKLTGFLVESEHGLLRLAVPDPLHVLIRSGPTELSCGEQATRTVKVEFAAAQQANAGTLRGLEFQSNP